MCTETFYESHFRLNVSVSVSRSWCPVPVYTQLPQVVIFLYMTSAVRLPVPVSKGARFLSRPVPENFKSGVHQRRNRGWPRAFWGKTSGGLGGAGADAGAGVYIKSFAEGRSWVYRRCCPSLGQPFQLEALAKKRRGATVVFSAVYHLFSVLHYFSHFFPSELALPPRLGVVWPSAWERRTAPKFGSGNPNASSGFLGY